MDCLTTICLLFFGSCQLALTISTSAPELTVVGGLPAPPGYNCIGEEVTLRCTWNPDEVLLGRWDVNGTLHALEELAALEGHTATTANGQANLFITSSRNSITTYRCAANPHNDSSVTLRSNPTIVKYDDSSVSLDITHTRSTDSLSVTVRVQHRGCTDPIDTVMISINNTERNNCTRKINVVSNGQDLQPCEFGGLSQNRPYKITTMTRSNGGSFSEYPGQLISLPRNEGRGDRDSNTESATNTTWIIVGSVFGAVLLLSVLIVVVLSGGVLFVRCAKHKPANSPVDDNPSSDQTYSVPDVTLEPSPAYATVEGTTSQGKSLYMNF